MKQWKAMFFIQRMLCTLLFIILDRQEALSLKKAGKELTEQFDVFVSPYYSLNLFLHQLSTSRLNLNFAACST